MACTLLWPWVYLDTHVEVSHTDFIKCAEFYCSYLAKVSIFICTVWLSDYLKMDAGKILQWCKALLLHARLLWIDAEGLLIWFVDQIVLRTFLTTVLSSAMYSGYHWSGMYIEHLAMHGGSVFLPAAWMGAKDTAHAFHMLVVIKKIIWKYGLPLRPTFAFSWVDSRHPQSIS